MKSHNGHPLLNFYYIGSDGSYFSWHSADVGRLLAYLGFSLLAESVAKGVSSYATHLAVFTLSLSFL